MAKADLTKEALGFVPGVGTAMDVASAASSLARGDIIGAGIDATSAALNLIPGAGKLAGNALKFATKAFRKADAVNAQNLMDSKEGLEAWRMNNKLPASQRQANLDVTEEAAEDLFQGTKRSKKVRDIIDDELPITSMYSKDTFPDMPTVTEAAGALGEKAGRKGIIGVKGFDLKQGQLVGARLDIPAYNEYDKWVVSLHKGDSASSAPIGYGQAVRLKDVVFTSKSNQALDIARRKVLKTDPDTGKPIKRMGKSTIARATGKYQKEDPYKIQQDAYKLIDDPEWSQIGMNPYRGSHFYNKATGEPVFAAAEIIQVGPLVLAKGLKKPTLTQMKKFYGGEKDLKTGLYSSAARTKDGKIRVFNQGGDAMEQQMEMAFMNEGGVLKDDGMNKDPVSGNNVPSGSMAEEVRDDIPAQLSEGEYVVPADVVRFHGVQMFEDLRNQAKQGFGKMEQDGRIGGQPVSEDFPFPMDQLQTFDEGGDTSTYEQTFGQPYTPGQRYGSMGGPQGSGFELVTYTSPDGKRNVVIPHYNGKPMSAVPTGFKAQESQPSDGGGTSGAPQGDEDGGDSQAPAQGIPGIVGSYPTPLADPFAEQKARDAKLTMGKAVDEYEAEDYINFYNDSKDGGIDSLLRNVPVLGNVMGMQYNNIRNDAATKLRNGDLGDINPTQFSAIKEFILTPSSAAGLLGFGRKEESPNTDLKDYTYENYTNKKGLQGLNKGFSVPTSSTMFTENALKNLAASDKKKRQQVGGDVSMDLVPKGTILNTKQVDQYIQDISKNSPVKSKIMDTATKMMLGIRNKGGQAVVSTPQGKDTPVTAEILNNINNNIERHEEIKNNLDKEDKDRVSRGEGPMDVTERFQRHHEQFTGFTSSGEFMGGGGSPSSSSAPQNIGGGGAFPTYDYDSGGAQNRGGLIGKTKPKKRKAKKGLGSKMAT